MGEKQKKQFEVIKEGFARATFGGVFSGCPTESVGGPIQFAALENNGGLNSEEFFATMARILSKAVTPYRKFDFTQGDVLKSSVGLFEGLTLYANHNPNVNDWKGLVQDCVWDDKNNPPGINAMIVVDRTIDPKLARGLEIKALRSLSVTIWFEYMKSHPDLANFYDRLGEEIDGEIVRFIVTRITNAGEVSVVWEGEDPYAKTFGAETGSPEKSTTTEGEDMKLSAATLAVLGIAAGTELTEALIEEKIVGLNGTITGLKTKVAELELDAKIGKETLTETRERAVTLYKAAKGEKVVEAFITGVIQTASLETARAFCVEYQTEVDKTVPLKCSMCGEPVTRQSSQTTETNQQLGGKRAEDYKL